ncbi:hypothetical protein, partial [Streptomyces scabiei]|uniref:hypothetical protein n=1 Tax=Streptomyces scabiei TaxID=1930 RepID=UPI0038D3B2D9
MSRPGLRRRCRRLRRARSVLSATTRSTGLLRAAAGTVPGVKPWTAETPNLYTLLVELYDNKGALAQSTSARIGFRTV